MLRRKAAVWEAALSCYRGNCNRTYEIHASAPEQLVVDSIEALHFCRLHIARAHLKSLPSIACQKRAMHHAVHRHECCPYLLLDEILEVHRWLLIEAPSKAARVTEFLGECRPATREGSDTMYVAMSPCA